MPADARASANRLTLDATIAQRDDLRYTPAGLPALNLMLHHASDQPEAGGRRKVDCEIAALAFGDVARGLEQVPVRTAIRCEGFLARRWRTGTTLALHIARYEHLTERITD